MFAGAMRKLFQISLAGAASMISGYAAAQSVLDRVDPATVEERVGESSRPSSRGGAIVRVETSSAAGPLPGLVVGAIDIVGLREMTRAAFAEIIERYVGRTLTGAELASLANALASRAREVYPLANATIERQSLRAGVLQIRIDEGQLDEVALDGPAHAAVLATLRPLVGAHPVTRAALERRLLLAEDIDGVTLGKVRVERRADRNVLVVPLIYSRFAMQYSLDNDSTRPLGPLEVLASGRANCLLDDDDTLHAFVLNSVPELSELTFARLRYANRLDTRGTRLTLTGSYSHSLPGSHLSPLEIEGRSWLVAASAQHPLVRSRRTSLWIDAAFAHRRLMQDRKGSLIRVDSLTTVRGSVFGNTRAAGGALRANAVWTQGLNLFDATRAADPLNSRGDADGTFAKLALSAEWTRKLFGGVGLNVAVRSQLASQPLLVAEEIGIGGAQFGRGYDYSERTGDKGTMAYAELNVAPKREAGPVDGIEFYVFADGGTVTNLANGFGSGSLFSTGGGVRIDVDRRTDAGFELALPLSGDRYDTGNASPRIRFSITRYH